MVCSKHSQARIENCRIEAKREDLRMKEKLVVGSRYSSTYVVNGIVVVVYASTYASPVE